MLRIVDNAEVMAKTSSQKLHSFHNHYNQTLSVRLLDVAEVVANTSPTLKMGTAVAYWPSRVHSLAEGGQRFDERLSTSMHACLFVLSDIGLRTRTVGTYENRSGAVSYDALFSVLFRQWRLPILWVRDGEDGSNPLSAPLSLWPWLIYGNMGREGEKWVFKGRNEEGYICSRPPRRDLMVKAT